jgi:hypothetical protein
MQAWLRHATVGLATMGMAVWSMGCTGKVQDTGEPPEEVEEEEEEVVVEDVELPEPLDFQECPEADSLQTLDASDLVLRGTEATASGTFMRCATWGFEQDAEACYADQSKLIDSIEKYLYELGFEALGGVLPVDCDVDVQTTCGPWYPEAVAEVFGDDEFRCCYNVDISATCRL